MVSVNSYSSSDVSSASEFPEVCEDSPVAEEDVEAIMAEASTYIRLRICLLNQDNKNISEKFKRKTGEWRVTKLSEIDQRQICIIFVKMII